MAILIAEKATLKPAGKMRGDLRNPGYGIRRRGVCRPIFRYTFTVLVLLLLIAGARRLSAQASPLSEYQVKAAFLFHFAQFVDWPSEAFKDAASPLTYCTVGEDPFHGALDASLNRKTIDGRPIRVLHFRQAREIQGCQILFIGTPEKKFISATLADLRGNPVLTVGESEDFVHEGGMIGFLLEDSKVRFEINVNAAEHAKLKISASLLALAKTVIGSPKGT